MSNDLILEYKEQIKLLKEQLEELEKSNKSKDSANKRCLQKIRERNYGFRKSKRNNKRFKGN
jgi:hypothetical protein